MIIIKEKLQKIVITIKGYYKKGYFKKEGLYFRYEIYDLHTAYFVQTVLYYTIYIRVATILLNEHP